MKQQQKFMVLIFVSGYQIFKFMQMLPAVSQLTGKYILIFFLILFGIVACSSQDYTEFSEPFELSAFLKSRASGLSRQTINFQILDAHGEPISYGLLRFVWIQGGRMDFQTNQDGVLSIQFEKDMLENKVMVSTKLKSAKIKVTW